MFTFNGSNKKSYTLLLKFQYEVSLAVQYNTTQYNTIHSSAMYTYVLTHRHTDMYILTLSKKHKVQCMLCMCVSVCVFACVPVCSFSSLSLHSWSHHMPMYHTEHKSHKNWRWKYECSCNPLPNDVTHSNEHHKFEFRFCRQNTHHAT